jgi:hypothetical protein
VPVDSIHFYSVHVAADFRTARYFSETSVVANRLNTIERAHADSR